VSDIIVLLTVDVSFQAVTNIARNFQKISNDIKFPENLQSQYGHSWMEHQLQTTVKLEFTVDDETKSYLLPHIENATVWSPVYLWRHSL